MNKLEILSMYLPYKLWVTQGGGVYRNGYVEGIMLNYIEHKIMVTQGGIGSNWYSVNEIKPILYDRDLTQKIWHNGKEIVPINELYKIYHKRIDADFDCDGANIICDSEQPDYYHLYQNEGAFLLRLSIPKEPSRMEFLYIQWCIEHKINLWLKDDEYIPVTNEFNPYK